MANKISNRTLLIITLVANIILIGGVGVILDQMIVKQLPSPGSNQIVFDLPVDGMVLHLDATASQVITTSYPITYVEEPSAIIDFDTNAYSSPSDQGAIIGYLRSGDTRRILTRTSAGDWFQVCCVQGSPAWLKNEDILIDGEIRNLPVYIDFRATSEAKITPQIQAAMTVQADLPATISATQEITP